MKPTNAGRDGEESYVLMARRLFASGRTGKAALLRSFQRFEESAKGKIEFLQWLAAEDGRGGSAAVIEAEGVLADVRQAIEEINGLPDDPRAG